MVLHERKAAHAIVAAVVQGKSSESLRGTPYLLPLTEISRRSAEAWQRGATEVCLQG